MRITSELRREAHAAAEPDRTPEAIALPLDCAQPAQESAQPQKYALLPIVVLGLALLVTVFWNALLLWQVAKALIWAIGYAFS